MCLGESDLGMALSLIQEQGAGEKSGWFYRTVVRSQSSFDVQLLSC